MKGFIRASAALLLAFCAGAFAVDTTLLPNEALQERYEALTHELRCMQCQNQSIADSPVDASSFYRAGSTPGIAFRAASARATAEVSVIEGSALGSLSATNRVHHRAHRAH